MRLFSMMLMTMAFIGCASNSLSTKKNQRSVASDKETPLERIRNNNR